MKENMQQWMSFVTFDLPLETDYINAAFAETHARQQNIVPQWSTTATRQKMIANYWFNEVMRHFMLLMVLPVSVTVLIFREAPLTYLGIILLAGTFSFLVLLIFNYWPGYSHTFLPRLETTKEVYEKKQLAQLEKCRQHQLSNLALALIFYVFDKASNINSLQSSDQYAGILVKLYGVDRGSLKRNLELILGPSSQRKNWTDRKRTEIENRFCEASQFFEELDFPEGIQLLNTLEAKILQR